MGGDLLMGLDLSRRRFIIGAFAAVAGVAAAPAIKAAEFLVKPKLEWDDMIAYLQKCLPTCEVVDETRLAHFVSIRQVTPRVLYPPKMLVGWDAGDWQKLTAEGQQESIEFIDQNMRGMMRGPDSIAGAHESLIRDNHLGIWAHADS
jgi:hypothetical protein